MLNFRWGQAAFNAYAEEMQGLTYDLRRSVNSQNALFEAYWGRNPAPSWHDLPELVKSAWQASACAAVRASETEREGE